MAARVTGIEVEPDLIVEPDKTAPTSFAVILESCAPARKIAVIRAVCALLGVSLREAFALVDALPSTIRENLPRSEAGRLKDQLEAVGAQVSLR